MRLPSSSSAPWTFWVSNSPSRRRSCLSKSLRLLLSALVTSATTRRGAEALIAARAEARAAKDWAVADAHSRCFGRAWRWWKTPPPALASRRNNQRAGSLRRFRSGGAGPVCDRRVHTGISSQYETQPGGRIVSEANPVARRGHGQDRTAGAKTTECLMHMKRSPRGRLY